MRGSWIAGLTLAVALLAAFVLRGSDVEGGARPAAAAPAPGPAPVADDLSSAPIPEGVPTFTADVAPLVYRSCTPCHHDGGSGPFPLVTYRDVEKRAYQIVLVTEERFMPPWKPLPGYGDFQDSRRLSDEEIETFRAWLFADTPHGDPADLPPPPRLDDGWALGEPDLVVSLPEPFLVPEEGRDVWATLKIPTDFPDDVYVRAIEARSNNERVLHHFMMFVDRLGVADDYAARAPVVGDDGMLSGESLFGLELYSESVMSWLPGVSPRVLPGGAAFTLPAGASLVLDTHFRTTGKLEEVTLDFGLHLADGPPALLPGIVYLAGEAMNVPPGVPDYTIQKTFVTPVDVEVNAISAHAHYVCRVVEAYATLPDGTREPLLRIDDWDFEWQDTYAYAEPIPLPAGSRIDVFFLYDNSADNPRNPFAPPRRTVTGLRTTDEMAITWIHVTVDTEEELGELKDVVQAGWDEVQASSQRNLAVWNSVIHAFDADQDHTLDPLEERRASAYVDGIWENAPHLMRAFDRDRDGLLADEERAAAEGMVASWHGALGRSTAPITAEE